MITIKNILCPVDFSDQSRRVLEHAVATAMWYGAEITLLHVLSTPPVWPDGLPVNSSVLPLGPEDRKHLLEELERFAEPSERAGVRVHLLLDDGYPTQRILSRAQAMGADLIVLGTHGASGFEHLVLGSVAEKVLRKAACPVLTVPPGDKAAPSALLFQTILCPVDFSASSTEALDYAVWLAAEARSHLIVLHVLEALPSEDPRALMHFHMPEYLSFLEIDARERMQQIVPEEVRSGIRPELVIASGKPYREVLRVAQEREAGLIVMGVGGRSALDLTLFGSTTNHVVRAASCPVLTIREGAAD
jgi:nucleotide-binding universal stress UspA family protein